ncbi:hypothetical protein KSB_95170 [Ktedonobacter robiniae]|uniref:Uncharacterized protein n=1 Tax=Ktedonobacter robiniae TaxID=2778365 RepID=A0ABQ3V7Y8_9CHLR|nr:hypothetical protein KSB_95170 [Ktedonobacter robiniae]
MPIDGLFFVLRLLNGLLTNMVRLVPSGRLMRSIRWLNPGSFTLKEEVREWDISTTPDEFARRTIYCGGRVFANKWELDEEIARIK